MPPSCLSVFIVVSDVKCFLVRKTLGNGKGVLLCIFCGCSQILRLLDRMSLAVDKDRLTVAGTCNGCIIVMWASVSRGAEPSLRG